ncbi:MAG: energy-coupling factor transporter ATPase [Mogibacterium sp.]|nr:energy-coupling factor transporter ATPase [Mogibacterium sp.]
MSIEVKDLTYIYNPGMPGETRALDGVSLKVNDGEVLGIIGHTGSGKSTLLQHLNGLLKPASGEVYVDGQCITDGSVKLVDIRRKVGLVFQYPEYQLFEETVSKDVAFGPRNVGLSDEEVDVRVKAAIQLVGLNYDEICDSSPFELSGGQKRRVAIAGVIAMRPSVLILDEPTAGLDPAAHREILSMIKVIHDNLGIIIIFVSHNMADIANLSDRVVVMDKARIAMQGTPQEVFSHEKELTAMGLDVPPMRSIMRKITDAIPSIHSSALTVEEAAHDIRAVIPAPAQK